MTRNFVPRHSVRHSLSAQDRGSGSPGHVAQVPSTIQVCHRIVEWRLARLPLQWPLACSSKKSASASDIFPALSQPTDSTRSK